MDLQLAGKRAIVTGGSRGIGKQIAMTLAQEGCHIATCARGDDALQTALSEFRANNVTSYGEAFDMREGEFVRSWFSNAVEALGGLDIVVSNVSTRPTKQGDEFWQEGFETDFAQHIKLQELSMPVLQENGGGSIVFIGSIAANFNRVPPGEEAYGAFKAALVSRMSQLAQRHAHEGIRFNAVAPGPIYFEGGFWDMVKNQAPEAFERANSVSPMGRMGTPKEVADAAVFLASPAASYITGTNLRIEGGILNTANF